MNDRVGFFQFSLEDLEKGAKQYRRGPPQQNRIGYAMVAQCKADQLPNAITEAIQDAWHDGYMEGQKITDPWSETNDK